MLGVVLSKIRVILARLCPFADPPSLLKFMILILALPSVVKKITL